MPEPRSLHSAATGVMSILMVLIGIALVVTTIIHGGGPLATGVLLGVLFVAAGGGRIYVAATMGGRSK